MIVVCLQLKSNESARFYTGSVYLVQNYGLAAPPPFFFYHFSNHYSTTIACASEPVLCFNYFVSPGSFEMSSDTTVSIANGGFPVAFFMHMESLMFCLHYAPVICFPALVFFFWQEKGLHTNLIVGYGH